MNLKRHENDGVRSRPESFSQWCLFLFRMLFLIVFALLYIGVCFFNSNSRFLYNMGLSVVIGIALFFVLLFTAHKVKGMTRKRRKLKHLFINHSTAVFFLIMFLLFAIQCRLDVAMYKPVGWDVSAIVEAAKDLTQLHTNDYFSQFPNNLLIVYILHGLLKAYAAMGGKNDWLYLAIVNTIIVDFAIGLVFFIGRRLKGTAAGFFSLGILILLFGISPWIQVPYSDTFSMWVVPAVLLLCLKARDAKGLVSRLIMYFLIGLVSMVGFYIKPFTLIITVALIMITVIRSFVGFRQFAASLLVCAVIITGCGSGYMLYRSVVYARVANQVDSSKEIPFTHYFMMGLNKQVSGATNRTLYGAYNAEDYRITLRQHTKAEKEKKNIEVATERLNKFGAGGYAVFLAQKANWIFSDGVFWTEGEGDDVDTPAASKDPLSQAIQSFQRFYGWNFPWYSDFEQGVWTLALFLMICPLFLRRDDYKNDCIMIARLAIFGLLLYLLLSEARSRYLISFLPAVAILSGYGMSLFYQNLQGSAPTAKTPEQ